MNPNQTRDLLKGGNLDTDAHFFPIFIKSLGIKQFRKIKNLQIDFKHPITLIAGTNKIGKTSIMTLIGCSHENFRTRDSSSGELSRFTWNKFIRFSKHDKQTEDWEYTIIYKEGAKLSPPKIGRRKLTANKWSGAGKRESQIKLREVVFIDTDRISPARSYPGTLWIKTQKSIAGIQINKKVLEYFNYIFEEIFTVEMMASHQNKKVYKLGNYSSFNTASGEDVILRILEDCLIAEKKSLLLIDELELGLHPRIQRRLMDVIFDIAFTDQKQFIISTHSPTLLATVSPLSRVFIQQINGEYRSIQGISVNGAFSKMDSEIFPLIHLFCEDAESEFIIKKVLDYIASEILDIHKAIKIFQVGPHNKVVECYNCSKIVYDAGASPLLIGRFAMFDGDKRLESNIPGEDFCFFLPGNKAPEYFLLEEYLRFNPNSTLSYHLTHTNVHALIDKCVENSIGIDKKEVLEKLWQHYSSTNAGKTWIDEVKTKILSAIKYFSDNS